MSSSTEAIHKSPLMASYVRNTRAVGVLWAIFTFCYAIVGVLIFFQPYWLGSTERSEQAGVFGLYQYCTYSRSADVSVETCRGRVADYQKILSPYFKAATVLVGISAVCVLLSIACMCLFLCVAPKFVYRICAGLQLIAFICLLVACVVYPAGWDNPTIRGVCGQEANKYTKGACELRWSYILALIGVFDLLFLFVLAFVLASKQIKQSNNVCTSDGITFANVPVQFQAVPIMQLNRHNPHHPQLVTQGALVPFYNGQYAGGHQHIPQAIVPGAGTVSQFSTSGMKPTNRARAEYAASVQNFQL